MVPSGFRHPVQSAADLLQRGVHELWDATHRNFNFTDLEPGFWPVWNQCRLHTVTSIEKMYALYDATRYIVAQDVPGELVECGVWRGGSALVMVMALLEMGVTDREIRLFDTFEGNVAPGPEDHRYSPQAVGAYPRLAARADEVAALLEATGYPGGRITLVKGRVQDTVPRHSPAQTALLRLDTDWYDSTYLELTHLFPTLSPRGVLILDDYGAIASNRAAVDRYFAENHVVMLLSRIDYAGRLGIKLPGALA